MTLLRKLGISFLLFLVSLALALTLLANSKSRTEHTQSLISTLSALDELNRTKERDAPAATEKWDLWGNLYVLNSDIDRYYSKGKNGLDEVGAGDDITDRGKGYKCEDYSVNCPKTTSDIIASVLLGVALLSLLFFLVVISAFAVKKLANKMNI